MEDGSSVEPTGFRKTGTPRAIELEVVKTTLAAEIGLSTGLFYVPRVLRADPMAGVLELERVPGLRTLTELTSHGHPDVERAVTILGASMAEVHRRLQLPPDLTASPPHPWRDRREDLVYVHGDLTTNNVCWDEAGHRLMIVDWSSAPLFGMPVTIADRCLDLAWFCASMFWSPSLVRRPLYPAEAICNAFLTSYAVACPSFSVERFRDFDHDLMVETRYAVPGAPLRAHVADRLRRTRWSRWLRTSRTLRELS